MVVIGVRGPEPFWLIAYVVGGLVAGAVCGTLVVFLKGSEPVPNLSTVPLRLFAVLWASPYTLLGLLVGVVGLCSGGAPVSAAASSSSLAAA